MIGPNRTYAIVPFADPRPALRLSDPDVGDTLLVVTAFGPTRGFLKTQSFVEFRVLASTHGVVIQPLVDDLSVESLPDKVVIGRPPGLILSAGTGAQTSADPRPQGYRPFDPQVWGFDAEASFRPREQELIRRVTEVPEKGLTTARLDLARFYLAQRMFAEAKAVLDVILAKPRPTPEHAAARVMRAVAQIMLTHYDSALKDLGDPSVRDEYDAPLWRALALAGLGRWSDAREGFKTLGTAAVTIPIELQRVATVAAVRALVETGDVAGADAKMTDLDALSVPRELEPTVDLLRGRIADALGHSGDALGFYARAAATPVSPSSVQAQLRKVVLEHATGKLRAADAITALESLALSWRGDDTEVETLQQLGRLYTKEGRYRDALQAMRNALRYHPHSQMTRQIQDEAAATFEALFLEGKGDRLSPVDALSLFYDFRQLTPPGRRGDEMIRRLADRLVSVDVLNQAADLLQHQIDHRLQGAARAQVAVRLASVYLMARKPDAALQALRDTRVTNLPAELHNQRLLLEARALSDTGQHDLALEVISNLQGKDVDRLRTDILWTARRWREAGEQIEREYGERWREFAPLTDTERLDILRAAIAYSLAEDQIGLDRFRDKYGPKMADGPDRRAFEVVTAPLGSAGAEFGDVAKQVSATSTLDQFLRELKTRYPDTAPAAAPPPVQPAPQPQSRAPAADRAS